MNSISEAKQSTADQLWRRLTAVKVVMLGITGQIAPFRPMNPIVAEEECAVWFFIRRSSSWHDEVGEGSMAHLLFVEGGTYVDIVGRLEISTSRTHIERYWSEQVSALYPHGRQDPDVMLLRFTPQSGHVWTSSGGILSRGLEVALAGLIGNLPGTPLAMDEIRFRRIVGSRRRGGLAGGGRLAQGVRT